MEMLKFKAAVIVIVLSVFAFATIVTAQRRDYMTDAEIELIRDAQDIDLRVAVLTGMIDRRLVVLSLDTATRKETSKEIEKWGPPPAGSRLQLLNDIRYILQKAIDDIDDVAEHDKIGLEQNKMGGKLFPKAVRSLAAAAERYRGLLQPLVAKTADQKEKGAIIASIESCTQIIEAVAQLPPEKPKTRN